MKRILVALGLLAFTACTTTFVGPRALSPKPTHSASFPEVESLQPRLEWQVGQEPGVTYDLEIFEVTKKTSFWKGTQHSLGPRVYQREALLSGVHQLEVPLAPGREHVWLVRERRGEQVGPWSQYSFFDFYLVAWRSGNMLYRFRTRDVAAAPEAR